MRVTGDARVWIALGALVVLALLLSIGRTTPQEPGGPETTPHRSSYRTRPSGLRAIYLTLERLGYPARRFHEPLDRLEEDGVLIIAEPDLEVTPREWGALRSWVERGNLLLLFSDSGYLIEPEERYPTFTPTTPVNAALVQPAAAVREAVTHVIQSPYRFEKDTWAPPGRDAEEQEDDRETWAPGGAAGAGRREAEIQGEGDEETPAPGGEGGASAQPGPSAAPLPVVTLYADAQGPALSYARCGDGAVFLSCSPWSISNEGIGQGDNLALLLNLLDGYGSGKDRPIYFDEYHHGHGGASGPLSLLSPVARGGLYQVGIALLLLVFAVGRRFGSVIPVEELERRVRSEYLTAMALLFKRARALELVAGKLRDETQRELARGLGLPPDARPEAIARAAQEKRGVDAERVLRVLEEADLLSVARDRQLAIDEGSVLATARRLHGLRKDILRWR